MTVRERVPLAPLTTLGVGGAARFFAEARDDADINATGAFARENDLPLFILGGGSNILVLDADIEGVVLKMSIQGVRIVEDERNVRIEAGAGVSWNAIVDEAGKRSVFGIENLAGIPGTVGGAVVQNIGAYGAELASVFEYADTVHRASGKRTRIGLDEADFGYRSSLFKRDPDLVVVRTVFRLERDGGPNLRYPDMMKVASIGTPLSTPAQVAAAVRAIRAEKFPSAPGEGTAGSFFKNPLVSKEQYTSLAERYPRLPSFPHKENMVKIPLAWILDRVLHLKGHAVGPVRLYEKQPLVIVTRAGATACDIDAFANSIARHVYDATGLIIEREVETFGVRVA